MSDEESAPWPPRPSEEEQALVRVAVSLPSLAEAPLRPQDCERDYRWYLETNDPVAAMYASQYTLWVRCRLFHRPGIHLGAFEFAVGLVECEADEEASASARCAFGTRLRPLVCVEPIGPRNRPLPRRWVPAAFVPWLRLYIYWNTMTLYHTRIWRNLEPRPPRPSHAVLAACFARIYYALDRWLG